MKFKQSEPKKEVEDPKRPSPPKMSSLNLHLLTLPVSSHLQDSKIWLDLSIRIDLGSKVEVRPWIVPIVLAFQKKNRQIWRQIWMFKWSIGKFGCLNDLLFWRIDVWMLGAWRVVFDLWELKAAPELRKDITLPPCYFPSSSMQITSGHHQLKVPHPSNKKTNKTIFCTKLSTTLPSEKTSKKGGVKWWRKTTFPPSIQNIDAESSRIRRIWGSGRCSTWYLDLCPLAPPPPILSLRYLKGHDIFDTVAMGSRQ